MPWSDPCMFFYTGCLGAMIGAAVCVFALRKSHSDSMNLLHSYWNQDIRSIKSSMSELDRRTRVLAQELSTEFVEKHVSNHCKSFYSND